MNQRLLITNFQLNSILLVLKKEVHLYFIQTKCNETNGPIYNNKQPKKVYKKNK